MARVASPSRHLRSDEASDDRLRLPAEAIALREALSSSLRVLYRHDFCILIALRRHRRRFRLTGDNRLRGGIMYMDATLQSLLC